MRGLQVSCDGGRVECQNEVARSERLGEEEVDGLDRVRDDRRAAPVKVIHEDVERRVLGGQVDEFPYIVLEQVKVAAAAGVERVFGVTLLGSAVVHSISAPLGTASGSSGSSGLGF